MAIRNTAWNGKLKHKTPSQQNNKNIKYTYMLNLYLHVNIMQPKKKLDMKKNIYNQLYSVMLFYYNISTYLYLNISILENK